MLVPEVSRARIRVLLVAIFIVLVTVPASAFISEQLASEASPETKRVDDVTGPPRDGYTAITTQEFSTTYPDAELIVLAPDGTTVYVNNRWDTYFDVDQVPERSETVEYVAAKYISHPKCNTDKCTREVYVRENFSTGESQVIWSRITADKLNTRVHDIDRLNESRIVVADVYRDEVFVYDTEREIRVWTWRAQQDFELDSGGPFPDDWTHINDVEILPDGRFMISLRNQESVVFIARNGTLLHNQTLGADGQHDILYEQHNPDYLPGRPPSILVADSENDRIVEYSQQSNEWTRIWTWRDSLVQWPRDADRLPNGHTLVSDTNGNRVVEINESGSVIWSVSVGLPYEAERLSTDPESAGGPSAVEAGLDSRDSAFERNSDPEEQESRPLSSLKNTVRQLVPQHVRQGLTFILPKGLFWWHVPLLVGALADLVVLGAFEFRWSKWRLVLTITRQEK